MAKRASKKKAAAPEAAGPSDHYEGKVHYPKTVFSTSKKGELVSRVVATAAEHKDLLEREADRKWADSPADHGFETHPAAKPSEE